MHASAHPLRAPDAPRAALHHPRRHRQEYGLSRAEKGCGAQVSALAWYPQGPAYPGRQAASPAVALRTGGSRANASPGAPSAAGTAATLEHYWQIYWASYWNSPSKLFTGRFTAHITGKKDYCPVTGVPVTTKHVTGAAVTTKREHMRASVNRQLGQLLCRAPECGLFWGMQPHTVGIRTAQGRVTCAARTGVRGRCEPEGWHAR